MLSDPLTADRADVRTAVAAEARSYEKADRGQPAYDHGKDNPTHRWRNYRAIL
jgi:hypothetical protein